MAENDVWITGAPAVRLSGENVYMLQKLALLGLIRYRATSPAKPIRFHREDLERLAAERGATI